MFFTKLCRTLNLVYPRRQWAQKMNTAAVWVGEIAVSKQAVFPLLLCLAAWNRFTVYLGKLLINSFVKSRTMETAFPQWWLVQLCCRSLKFPIPSGTSQPCSHHDTFSLPSLHLLCSAVRCSVAVSLSLLITCWKDNFSNSVPGGQNKWVSGGLARPGGLQPASQYLVNWNLFLLSMIRTICWLPKLWYR